VEEYIDVRAKFLTSLRLGTSRSIIRTYRLKAAILFGTWPKSNPVGWALNHSLALHVCQVSLPNTAPPVSAS
jgi:hypothetical protein